MKRYTHPILLALGVGLAALAPQPGAAQEDKSPWVVRQRGPDHRIWEQVVREPHPWGGSIARTNRFTELQFARSFARAGGPRRRDVAAPRGCI